MLETSSMISTRTHLEFQHEWVKDHVVKFAGIPWGIFAKQYKEELAKKFEVIDVCPNDPNHIFVMTGFLQRNWLVILPPTPSFGDKPSSIHMFLLKSVRETDWNEFPCSYGDRRYVCQLPFGVQISESDLEKDWNEIASLYCHKYGCHIPMGTFDKASSYKSGTYKHLLRMDLNKQHSFSDVNYEPTVTIGFRGGVDLPLFITYNMPINSSSRSLFLSPEDLEREIEDERKKMIYAEMTRLRAIEKRKREKEAERLKTIQEQKNKEKNLNDI